MKMKKIYTLSKYHHKSSTTGVNKRGKWMMVGIENKINEKMKSRNVDSSKNRTSILEMKISK